MLPPLISRRKFIKRFLMSSMALLIIRIDSSLAWVGTKMRKGRRVVIPFSSNGFIKIKYISGLGKWILMAYTPHTSLYQSTDGINWTLLHQTFDGGSAANGFDYDPTAGRLVFNDGATDASIWYSNNGGANFTKGTDTYSGGNFNDVFFMPNINLWWAATGSAGTGSIQKSSNGSSFTTGGVSSFTDSAVRGKYLPRAGAGVMSGFGAFGWFAITYDGTTVTTKGPGGTVTVRDLAESPTSYVACGFAGLISRTTDLSTWTTITSPVATNLSRIKYLNGSYWITGASGVLLRSTNDGVTFTQISLGTTSNLNDIEYNGGRYVVVGASCFIKSSTDGTTWV